jgi:hypothetical protein
MVSDRLKKVERVAAVARRLLLDHACAARQTLGLRPTFDVAVVANSIPKAGTNLLLDLLVRLGGFCVQPGRTLRGWHDVDVSTLRAVETLRRGKVRSAHLPWHPQLASAYADGSPRHLLIVRDPRDICVSVLEYVSTLDRIHPAHAYLARDPDEQRRLLAIIEGVPGVFAGLRDTLTRFAPWLQDPNTLVVRFEHLCTGSAADQRAAMAGKIIEYLGLGARARPFDIASSTQPRTTNLTFRSGRSGDWRTRFGERALQRSDELAGELIERFGYARHK